MLKKLSLFVIGVLMGAVVFTSPASAGGKDSDHKVGHASMDMIGAAVAEHGKAVGEDMSLGKVAYETSCYHCSSQRHNDQGDGSHVDIDRCDVTVKDPVNGRTEHQYANMSSWMHEGQGEGGGWMQLDYDDVVVKKGVLEVVSLGIVCQAIESPSNHSFDYRSRFVYDDGYFSRGNTRGRSEAAEMTGIIHSIEGDVTGDYLEHYQSRSSYPYQSGGGKG